MSDSKSFIEPFKSRLMEVFNASSSGDEPNRQAYYAREEPKSPKKKETEGWEKESEHLFEDFLSLDEERITHGLAKAQVRKAMDRKYRKSQRSDQLEQETRAIEDTLEYSEIPQEITEQKLALVSDWRADLERLIASRHHLLVGWLDLLSRPAWNHLAQQGMPPRFLLNLMIIAYYSEQAKEMLDNPEALLYLQLHVQWLNLGLKADDILTHIEKFTIDLHSFESMLNQSLHALERSAEFLDSFATLVQVRCSQARPYVLQKLEQPYLDPDRRLARYHLEQRYVRLYAKIQGLQERLSAHQALPSEEMAHSVQKWHGQALYLGLLNLLNLCSSEGLPNDREGWLAQHLPQGLSQQEHQLFSQIMDLQHLEQWWQKTQTDRTPEPAPGFISDAVLEQDILNAIEDQDLNLLEKWALCKAYYLSLFRRQGLAELKHEIEVFLPLTLN